MSEQKVAGPARRQLTPAQAFDMAVALHRQGRLREAGQVYRAILKLDPDHVGALHYLGAIATQLGRPQDAERLLRRALALKPELAEAHNDLGIALGSLGRLDEARSEYEQAVALAPEDVEAHNNLGNALHALGRSREAIGHFEKALVMQPQAAEVHNNLGNALAAVRREEHAMASLRQALAIRPDFAEAHNNLGFVLAALGRTEEAIAAYRQAAELQPRYFEAHNNLGNAFISLRRYEDAVPSFERALAARPDAHETLNHLGNALATLGRHAKAESHYRRASVLKPDFFEAHNNLGNALAALGRHEEALGSYERALAVNPGGADAVCNLANSLAALGRHDEALARYGEALTINPNLAEAHASLGNELRNLGQLDAARQALEKAVTLAPSRADFHRSLAESKRFTPDDAQLQAMQALAADMSSMRDSERIDLHFALGKACADIVQREQAFRHFLEGNTLRRQQFEYDEAASLARFERLKRVFTAELIEQTRGLGDPTQVPVFIVGMPRSGTTLVEQVLASHREVTGGGELEHMTKAVARLERREGANPFPEIMRSIGANELRAVAAEYLAALGTPTPPSQRITDKLPGNFLMAGLIHLAMPNARIVHIRRDPVDTCFSCFSKLFAGDLRFTYDLAELGRYYRAYADLMAHWHDVLPEGAILEVQYEALVGDLAGQARRILTYCGLEWDEACLAFHQTHRPVLTASATQVRQPIYGSSVGRWRAYEAWLGPLLEALGPP